MRLMLDTQIIAWLGRERSFLNAGERAAIEAHANALVVSVISVWELRLKWWKSTRKAERDQLIKPDEALRLCSAREIPILPFTDHEVAVVLEPKIANDDPFDEILLVHAQQTGSKLLTRDTHCLAHPLAYHA